MRGVRHFEQLRLFAKAGHSVRAVVPLGWTPAPLGPRQEIDDAGILVAHPRYFRPPLRRWRSAAGIGAALERRFFARAAASELSQPDIVLAHSATFPGGLLGRVGHAPFVVTLHNNEPFDSEPQSKLVRRVVTRTLRAVDCVVYQSEALRRHGFGLAGSHESRIIPIGIDVFYDLPTAPPSRFTVCCVARLVPSKGVDMVVRAFARLAATLPEARLVVVGDGRERCSLELLAETLRLNGKVDFVGPLDRRGAQEKMANSSVLAMPSAPESLGAVYFEAMSLAVPALGTEGEGISEYIQHGVDGILIPRGNEERLYDELKRLAMDRERARRIGQAGRKLFLSRGPSWQANVAAHLALFDELRRKRADRP